MIELLYSLCYTGTYAHSETCFEDRSHLGTYSSFQTGI